MEKVFKSIFIGLIILILLIFFHYLGWTSPVESLVVKIVSPVQRGFYQTSLSVANFKQSWFNKRDLLAENQVLIERLKQFQLDQSEINTLKEENILLKKELGFADKSQLQFVSAKIITGISDPVSRSVVINKGKNNGITEGSAVVAEGGIIVGKIYEVYDSFSKVLLLNDNTSLVAATIQNLDKTVGLVEGQFGLSFSMTNIPRDQEVAEGDLVVTSGLEGNIPKNLLIAEVEAVNQSENEIFKVATLKPIISFDNLSYVLVITTQNEL